MKKIEPICKNCLLYNHEKKECRAAILIDGKEYHIPVDMNDHCHMDELGIDVQQVRWWTEDNKGNIVNGNGTVKIEYPDGFFGKEGK